MQYNNVIQMKKKAYSQNQIDMAALAKALAHPARIAIMDYLASVDACICGDIVDELPLAQPTVSQHLKELKNAGLIKGIIEGNAICYCIDENTLDTFKEYINQISSVITEKNIC